MQYKTFSSHEIWLPKPPSAPGYDESNMPELGHIPVTQFSVVGGDIEFYNEIGFNIKRGADVSKALLSSGPRLQHLLGVINKLKAMEKKALVDICETLERQEAEATATNNFDTDNIEETEEDKRRNQVCLSNIFLVFLSDFKLFFCLSANTHSKEK